MINFKKILIWIIIVCISIAIWHFVIIKIKGCLYGDFNQQPSTIIIHDTNVVVRYEYKVDTVIKWYERIVWKESPPKVIYQQQLDTVYLEKYLKYDLMLGLERINNKLRIWALNQDGLKLKEEIFDDVGPEFKAYSTTSKIVIKSKRWYWEGINLLTGLEQDQFKKFKPDYVNNLRTGFNYFDKVGVEFGIRYNWTNKQINGFANLKLKIIN